MLLALLLVAAGAAVALFIRARVHKLRQALQAVMRSFEEEVLNRQGAKTCGSNCAAGNEHDLTAIAARWVDCLRR